jgi:hypothetical protein
MRSEYTANEALAARPPLVQPWPLRAPTEPRKRRYWGWNEKALALAFGLFVAGTVAQSKACMGLGCLVLCFGIRPYWK